MRCNIYGEKLLKMIIVEHGVKDMEIVETI